MIEHQSLIILLQMFIQNTESPSWWDTDISHIYRNTLCHFPPFVIFPPPSKKFLKKIIVRCHFPPPEFKHIMFKNYVFYYIILIKLNKIFKIIFQKFFCWPLSFSPLTKICKIVTFWGENDKGYYGNWVWTSTL